MGQKFFRFQRTLLLPATKAGSATVLAYGFFQSLGQPLQGQHGSEMSGACQKTRNNLVVPNFLTASIFPHLKFTYYILARINIFVKGQIKK
jgi:hypothetical protein